MDATARHSGTPTVALGAFRRGGASGLIRNWRLVHERAGWVGMAALIGGRGLRPVASYRRVTVIARPASGDLRPDLEPERSASSDPGIERLYADLRRSGEPGVNGFSPEELRRRFARGDELWAFRVNGRIAHLRWTANVLPLAGLSMPLAADERANDSAITLPRFRCNGLSSAASGHVRAVLGREGTRTVFSAIDSFNRAFIQGLLRAPGTRRVADVEVVGLANRRWIRVVPRTQSSRAMLEARGVATADPARGFSRIERQLDP